MPFGNDLTPEEEAEFTAQGVTSLPPRDEIGRFTSAAEPAPAEPVVEVVVEAPAVPAVPTPPAPAAPVTPEAPAATPEAPASEAAAPPPGFVPHAALHQERIRAQQAIQQSATVLARANAILNRVRGEPATPMPDMQADPVAYLTALEERVGQAEQVRQQETQTNQIDTLLTQDENTFALLQPDYEQASEHYLRSRVTELEAIGATREEIQLALTQEARAIAQQSWQRGVPAAKTIYTLAQARGYQTPQPTADPVPQPAVPTPQPAPTPAPVSVAPSATIAAIQAGQAAGRSLSGAAGGGAAAIPNAEALASMTDEEFEAALGIGQRGANSRFQSILG